MIKVNRGRRDERGRRISPGRKWFTRAKAARKQVIASARANRYKFDATVYASNSVRTALIELFFDKCAYCEYSLTRSEWNVEHYRPKASVAEARTHPGYYWLAYEWSNLLPSCTFCNQWRREPPVWPSATRSGGAGKADSFPLVHEARRAYSPSDDVSQEEPLLLNPAEEDPSKHVSFDPSGRPFGLTERGKRSIAAYNLDFRRLNIQRRVVIDRMVGLVERRNQARDAAERKFLSTQISRETARTAEYAAVARAVISNPTLFVGRPSSP